MSDPPANPPRPLGILIVDRSTSNRRNIASVFADHAEVEFVGEAGDGETALELVTRLKPDLITLDLMEAPRVDVSAVARGAGNTPAPDSPRGPMDGLAFLRVLMSTAPTPVIVITRETQRQNVFDVLEAGALDVIPIPVGGLGPDATEVRMEILQKVALAHHMRASRSMRDTRTRPSGEGRSDSPPRDRSGWLSRVVAWLGRRPRVQQPSRIPSPTPPPRSADSAPPSAGTIAHPGASSVLDTLAKLEPDEQATILAKAAVELQQAGNIRGAMMNYERILERFQRAETGIQGLALAMATYNMGLIYGLSGQQDVELRFYEALVGRFGDSSDPGIQHKVAMALFNKAVRLRDRGDLEEAIRVHDELLARFGDEPDVNLREQVSAALLDRAEVYGRLGRTPEELRDYEELLGRFGDETTPPARRRGPRQQGRPFASAWPLARRDSRLGRRGRAIWGRHGHRDSTRRGARE